MPTRALPDGRLVIDPSDATREWDIHEQLVARLAELRGGASNSQTLGEMVGALARLHIGECSTPPDVPPAPPAVPAAHAHVWGEVTGKPASYPPDAHTHPELPTTGQKNALAGTQGTPGATNQYVTTQDPRNSDARPPTAHTHTASQVTDFNATGDARWALAGQGGFSWTAVPRQAADSTQATTAFKASDLTFPFVANGVYAVELFLLMRSSLATAGFRLALDTSVAVTTVALNFAHTLANAGTVTSGQSRADAIATGLSSGVDTVNVDIPVFGHGILVAGANAGTATLVFGPEVTATATMKANSVMRVHKVA